MSTLFPVIFSILSILGTLLVVGGVVYAIIYFTKKKKDEKLSLSVDLLLKIYLYVISIATLAISVIGGTMLLKSASSYVFGVPFAYDTYKPNELIETEIKQPETNMPACYEGKETEINGQKVCFNNDQIKQDLINGGTIFFSMIILFTIHMIGIKMIEKKNVTEWLRKAYTFISLIIYSLVGIVTIPIAIYQLSTHLLYRIEDITKYEAPATALSLLILVLPLWIYYLLKTTKLRNKN